MKLIDVKLLQRCRILMYFGFQAQRSKNEFHYLTLRRFHTSSMSEGKKGMKAEMATYLSDLASERMKRAD